MIGAADFPAGVTSQTVRSCPARSHVSMERTTLLMTCKVRCLIFSNKQNKYRFQEAHHEKTCNIHLNYLIQCLCVFSTVSRLNERSFTVNVINTTSFCFNSLERRHIRRFHCQMARWISFLPEGCWKWKNYIRLHHKASGNIRNWLFIMKYEQSVYKIILTNDFN